MYFTKTPFLAKHLFKEITWSIPTKEKIIYLSFDDGPTPEITEWTLDLLKKYNAKATFFCIGKNIEKYPEIFRKIISENHSIGNHTYDHLNGWKTSTEEYIGNVEKCKRVIGRLETEDRRKRTEDGRRKTEDDKKEKKIKQLPTTDYRLPTTLFRPPYGKILKSQILNLKSHYNLIMWDILSGDFDQKLSGEKCLNNVVKNAKNGSIVVFHDSVKASKNLFYTLPKTLEFFAEKGYVFGGL